MRLRTGVALALVVALAALARAVGFERVFLDDGTVVLAASDPYYHAYRALYSLHRFPHFLSFDPCVIYPRGATSPYPPLFDLALAAAGLLAGGGRAVFERVVAWSPVPLGALTVLPVYAIGRRVWSSGVGLGAGLLYAFLPIAVLYSQVGNADHHAAVALLGACLLLAYVAILDERTRGRRLVWLAVGLGLARAAILLVWQGSLFYLAPGELALVAAACLQNRRDVLWTAAASCALSIALVAPFLAAAAMPELGPYSSVELSRLHLLALGVEGLVCVGVAALERRRPAASAWARLARAGALSVLLGASLLLLPGLLDGLAPALRFVSKSDDFGSHIHEQLPLFFEQGGFSRAAGERRMGLLAYLLGLVPLAFLGAWRRPAGRAPALLLFGWTLLVGGMAVQQYRYGNDWAPAGCVGAAIGVVLAVEAARARLRLPEWVRLPACAAIGALLLAPTLPRFWLPHASLSVADLDGDLAGQDRALLTVAGAQVRFAQAVRRALGGEERCEPWRPLSHPLAVLAHLAIGHVLLYEAGAATPASVFGPYVGGSRYHEVVRFPHLESEDELLDFARSLGTRWVVTADEGSLAPPDSLAVRLHQRDGSAGPGAPSWGHLRLVTEGPRGGLPLSAYFEAEIHPGVPYKLYEIVPGARIEVPGRPGEAAVAAVRVETPIGRAFRYRAAARVEEDGFARVRVPYWTGGDAPTRAVAPYRVRSGDRTWSVEVPEHAVRRGLAVRLEP